MKGVLLLILIVGVIAFLYFSGILSPHTFFQRIYNETITVSSSTQATFVKQIDLPEAGWVNITVTSQSPITLQAINGTDVITLGYGSSIHIKEFLSKDFELVIRGLNGTAYIEITQVF